MYTINQYAAAERHSSSEVTAQIEAKDILTVS
jgi:hypothetical protein